MTKPDDVNKLPGEDVVSRLEEADYKIKHEDSTGGRFKVFGPKTYATIEGEEFRGRIPRSDDHENYMGIKNEEAGYDAFSLGLKNETEKALDNRFGDLESRLVNYLGGDGDENYENWVFYPGGDGKSRGIPATDELVLERGTFDTTGSPDPDSVDEEGNANYNPNYGKDIYDLQFDAWIRQQHSAGGNIPDPNREPTKFKRFMDNMSYQDKLKLEKEMNKDIETAMNLENDLEEAANNGYYLDQDVMANYFLDDPNKNPEFQPTDIGKQKKEILDANEELLNVRKGNIRSVQSMEEFEELLVKNDGNFTDAWSQLPDRHKKRIYGYKGDGSIYSSSSNLNKDIYSSPIIEQNWNRIMSGLQEETTKDGLGFHNWNEDLFGEDPTNRKGNYEYNPALTEGIHTEPYQWDYDPRLAKDYDPSNVEVGPPVQTGDVITDDTEEVIDDGTGSVTGDGTGGTPSDDTGDGTGDGTEGDPEVMSTGGAGVIANTGDGTEGDPEVMTTGGSGVIANTDDPEVMETGGTGVIANTGDGTEGDGTNELSSIPDSEQENRDKWAEKEAKRKAMFADAATPQTVEGKDEYTPQTQQNAQEEEEEEIVPDPEVVTTGDEEYIPQTQREDEEEYTPQSLTKTVNSPLDYSKPNPFRYGSDDYYGFQKKAMSHKLGLAKRVFNVYSK
jgi:hypothetical protein